MSTTAAGSHFVAFIDFLKQLYINERTLNSIWGVQMTMIHPNGSSMSLVGLPGSGGFSPDLNHEGRATKDATRLTTSDPLQAGQATMASMRKTVT